MSALPFLGGKLRRLRLSAHRPRLRLRTSGAVRSTEDAAGKPPHRPEPHDPRAMSRRTARSEEHTSELQSLLRISYAVFCLKKKKTIRMTIINNQTNYTRDQLHNTDNKS